MKLIIDIPDSDYTAVRCEALYYIGHDKLAESVTTAFQTATPYEERPQGKWIDHSEDYGYVECPICHELTTCDDNADELHYCWKCGAYMRRGSTE